MAKPTQNAVAICSLVTVIAIVGALASIVTKNPLWIFILLLPTVAYEAYRTQEGASTKISSFMLGGILLLEIALIVFGINYDLANFFGESEKYIAGYYLPLGDIKVFGPILTAVLSMILIFRTYGIYTKWLSIVICIGSLIAVYLISPDFFQNILKIIVNGLFDQVSSI